MPNPRPRCERRRDTEHRLTGRNLAATWAVRLGLGDRRDVSVIEGEVDVIEIYELPQERG